MCPPPPPFWCGHNTQSFDKDGFFVEKRKKRFCNDWSLKKKQRGQQTSGGVCMRHITDLKNYIQNARATIYIYIYIHHRSR